MGPQVSAGLPYSQNCDEEMQMLKVGHEQQCVELPETSLDTLKSSGSTRAVFAMEAGAAKREWSDNPSYTVNCMKPFLAGHGLLATQTKWVVPKIRVPFWYSLLCGPVVKSITKRGPEC